MKVESGEDIDNIIVPQRFIPFDIGTKITEQYVDDIKSYVEKRIFYFRNSWIVENNISACFTENYS